MNDASKRIPDPKDKIIQGLEDLSTRQWERIKELEAQLAPSGQPEGQGVGEWIALGNDRSVPQNSWYWLKYKDGKASTPLWLMKSKKFFEDVVAYCIILPPYNYLTASSLPKGGEPETEVYELKRKIADLERWKREAIGVDFPRQEIAKALNIGLGEPIHEKTLPAIMELKRRITLAGTDNGWVSADKKPKVGALIEIYLKSDFIEVDTYQGKGFSVEAVAWRRHTPPTPVDHETNMRTTYHVQMSIEGLLRQSNYKLGKLFDRHGPSVRTELKNRLANGEKLIGSDRCDGFDPVTGCPGHAELLTPSPSDKNETE